MQTPDSRLQTFSLFILPICTISNVQTPFAVWKFTHTHSTLCVNVDFPRVVKPKESVVIPHLNLCPFSARRSQCTTAKCCMCLSLCHCVECRYLVLILLKTNKWKYKRGIKLWNYGRCPPPTILYSSPFSRFNRLLHCIVYCVLYML